MPQHPNIRAAIAVLPAVILGACASVAPFTRIDGSDRAVEARMNGSWTVIHADGKTLEDTAPPATLVFETTRRTVSGFDGCNNFRGSYRFEGGLLKARLAATRRACTGATPRMVSARINDLFDQGAEVVDISVMGTHALMLRNADGDLRMGPTRSPHAR